MAVKKRKAKTRGLQQDRLVEQLVPDPNNHQPAIQLTGWLGNGTTEGTWRLYLTPQLSDYVEFSEEDVVHSQPVPEDQSSLGGTIVWLDAATKLEYIRVVRRQVQADFLSGGITSDYLAGTGAAFSLSAAAAKPVPGNTRGYQCSINPHIPACQERTEACPIGSAGGCGGTGAFCGTGAFVCGATVGCSVGRECSFGC